MRVVDNGATPPASQGHELMPVSFPGNVTAPIPAPISSGEALLQREMEIRELIRQEIEKYELRREIMREIAAARRRELEEEVRREMAVERDSLLVSQQVSMSMNSRMNQPVNNINTCGRPQPQLPHQVDINQNQNRAQNNKQKVNILARTDADISCVKRKAVTPPTIDDGSELSTSSLQKKPKRYWSCELCHVTATSEKGLNDHLRGKKHKAKEAPLTTPKIGLDPRPPQPQFKTLLPNNIGTLDSGLDPRPPQPQLKTLLPNNIGTLDSGLDPRPPQPQFKTLLPNNIGTLEPGKEDHAKQQSEGLGDLKNKNETIAVKKAGQTSAAKLEKKFQFWCALCEVHTRSEAVMQSHKAGKKHLANMKKASQINGP